MKLKNKLIPLSCLSVGFTCIFPLTISSCGKANVVGRSFDLTKKYYPTIKSHAEGMGSVHTLNEIYSDQLKIEPETFVQDYLWSKSTTGFAFEQFLFWRELLQERWEEPTDADKLIIASPNEIYSSDEEVISHLEISYQTANWNGEDWTFPTLSFTLTFNSVIHEVMLKDYYFGEEQISGYINGTTSGSIKFLHVPFYVIPRTIKSYVHDVTTQIICFEPFFEWMAGIQTDIDKEVEPWRIETVCNSQVNGEVIFTTGLTQRIADDWTLNVVSDQDNPVWKYADLTLEKTIGRVFETPYYLSKMQVGNE